MDTWVYTIVSDVYSLGLVLLQMLLGQPDVGKAKQAATQLKEEGSFMSLVDPHMPGDKPAEVLEELFSLALVCIRTDNPNFRPKVGSPVSAPPDDSTVLARVEAVLQQWSHPHAFAGQLEAFRQELSRASLQQREVASQPQLHSNIPLPKHTY